MKRFWLGFYFIGWILCTTHAQVIYVSSLTRGLYRLDITACQLSHVTHTEERLFDIAFHPDGELYGITPDGKLVQVDTLDGSFVEVHDFFGTNFNSLTAAADGIIYAIGMEGDLWSYNPADQVVRYYGNIGFIAAGDLTFRNGQLYLAAVNDEIVRIDLNRPSNSTVVIHDDVRGDIFGIVSYAENCEEIITYAITDELSAIYEINFATGELDLVCNLPIEVGGGASTYEFLGSSGMEVSNVLVTPGNCYENAGAISFDVTGGFGSLQYAIDGINYSTSSSFANLTIGDYTLSVIDSIGCMITFPFSIPASDGPVIKQAMVTYETCDADNGIITIHATGGEQPLQYALDDGAFQAGNSFTGLTGGSYTLHVMDQSGCATDTLVQLLSIAPSGFTNVLVEDTRCDSINGRVTILGATGYPPFEYTLSGYPPQPGNVFEALPSGDYFATLTDRFGCMQTQAVSIRTSTRPEIEDVIIRHATCGEPNGHASVIALDQSQTFEYSMDGSTFQASPSFDQLPGQTHTFYMRDKSGCVVNREADVQSSRPLLIEHVVIKEASCGERDGEMSFDLVNARQPVSVQLNAVSTDHTAFTSLAAGEYALHIEDGLGCSMDTVIAIPAAICPVYIPNIFSPDGDGMNDHFALSTFPGYSVFIRRYEIIDRWGNIVFSDGNFYIDDADNHWWDGTHRGEPVGSNVFVYRIEVMFENGEFKTFVGDVTVIRKN